MSNQEILGREDVNDLDAILAITNTDVDEVVHAVKDNADAIFTWDYEQGAARRSASSTRRPRPRSGTARPTSTGRSTSTRRSSPGDGRWPNNGPGVDLTEDHDSPMAKWTEKEWIECGIQQQNWMLSQFMHGEQGALLCTRQDRRDGAVDRRQVLRATQVMDEARHVEVFAKYLDTKLSGHYPINAHLRMLLDDIIADSRWDMTYLGMQIMVEGLAPGRLRLHARSSRPSRCSSSCCATS